MSLDSHVQIKRQILEEIQEWLQDCELYEVTSDDVYDLSINIFDVLLEGRAIDPVTPATCGHDDEHYN